MGTATTHITLTRKRKHLQSKGAVTAAAASGREDGMHTDKWHAVASRVDRVPTSHSTSPPTQPSPHPAHRNKSNASRRLLLLFPLLLLLSMPAPPPLLPLPFRAPSGTAAADVDAACAPASEAAGER